MLKRLALVVALSIAVVSPALAEKTILARIASGQLPVPTFDQLHEQFTRVVLHESGFKSRSDQEGILDALLYGGGGRDPERRGRGTGYGLDYAKLMARMAKHSTRTFPRGSKFLSIISPERLARKARLRTYQNEWVSTLGRDCSQPSGWDESRSNSWLGYVKRCPRLFKSTREVLQGRFEPRCDGPITTWGSRDDRRREGGALDSNWHETFCDRPPMTENDPPMEKCSELRRDRWSDPEAKRELLNSTNCARNYFFSWLHQKDELAVAD